MLERLLVIIKMPSSYHYNAAIYKDINIRNTVIHGLIPPRDNPPQKNGILTNSKFTP